ncbi:MAG: hypothetical protein COU30_05595 [Candidatus Magasanikbacteria bacterium CG10_big_fil_rev_8_21_14_0_10_38_6]|uniref:Glycosyl transferase family 1 domain-containing protein n=1 Tax=Candidatus Magasanikbacteria bacterium CG10_big_fil_rev_8_21_14_0_10_38_6 TaxID=1974647 RepID=A0A2M6NZG3_9BACT|nr:MAG: hypothetical protein COU30_05595 [Candidatus Magasanikbacteria bacterium CG10_big_fil_rev_8_21_14_0_10_38_6]
MNILYIANSRIPTEKAHGLQIVKTIEAFIRAGENVRLLLPRRRNHITDGYRSFYHVEDNIPMTFVPNVFSFLETPFHKMYFFLQRVSFTIFAFFYGLFGKYDVIYSRELTVCFLLSIFGKMVVFEDHEPKKRFRSLYFLFVRNITKKVVVAENLLSLYKQHDVPLDAILVAPNGVDVKEFEGVSRDVRVWQSAFSFSEKRPVVLYVGHFYKWKGIYTLIDAAAFIDANVCLIGGIPQDRELVEKYIEEKGINNVYVHPFVKHHDIIRFIKSADVLVLPNTAKEERSASYTTPIKLFEYMVSGVPIVASDIESFSAYLVDEKNALLCSPDDSVDLAKKVTTLLTDNFLGKTISLAAYEKGCSFSWDSRASRILSFIRS